MTITGNPPAPPMESHHFAWEGWTAADVGCYWTRGNYAVCTISQGDRRGYAVYLNRQVLEEFCTWERVRELTDRRKRVNGGR